MPVNAVHEGNARTGLRHITFVTSATRWLGWSRAARAGGTGKAAKRDRQAALDLR
jgi:hypothetical protein